MLRGMPSVVEYEPDSELRDTEQVPLLEPGGIQAFFRREEIRADILAVRNEAEGLLDELVHGASK
jgi:hypothetical protein